MNKSQLIGGIICLAIAALLTVLNLTRPADEMMFMIGDINMPWVPPVVLGVVGVVLLATAGRSEEGSLEATRPRVINEEKAALNKRLETVAWGCFLVMLGGFAFVPEQIIAGGFWSIGVGVIMLGLNAARYAYGIKMSGFTTFLGVVSLISGLLEVLGVNTLGGPILLIVLGLYLVVKPWLEKRQLFGKAEES